MLSDVIFVVFVSFILLVEIISEIRPKTVIKIFVVEDKCMPLSVPLILSVRISLLHAYDILSGWLERVLLFSNS